MSTSFYLPIIIMSIIISVMLFTFLCSYKADRSKQSRQVQKIKYNIVQTPVTTKETETPLSNIGDMEEHLRFRADMMIKPKREMKYYSDETVNELR